MSYEERCQTTIFCYVVESRFGGPNEWQKIYPAISQINTKAGYIVLEAERDKFSQIKNGVVIMENLELFYAKRKMIIFLMILVW